MSMIVATRVASNIRKVCSSPHFSKSPFSLFVHVYFSWELWFHQNNEYNKMMAISRIFLFSYEQIIIITTGAMESHSNYLLTLFEIKSQ